MKFKDDFGHVWAHAAVELKPSLEISITPFCWGLGFTVERRGTKPRIFFVQVGPISVSLNITHMGDVVVVWPGDLRNAKVLYRGLTSTR